MKTILIFLSLCLIFNFISALETSKPQLNQQADNSSHLREGPYQQPEPHSHNAIIIHHQADSIDNNSTQLNQQNHSHLRGDKHSLQNTTVAQDQANQLIHPRFRSMLQDRTNDITQSSILTITDVPSNPHDNIQQNLPFLADNGVSDDTIQSSSLLQIITAKPIDNTGETRRSLSFAEYYYQQQLKAFFGHQHEKFPPPTHSNIKTGL
jgi:hypothetical protein